MTTEPSGSSWNPALMPNPYHTTTENPIDIDAIASSSQLSLKGPTTNNEASVEDPESQINNDANENEQGNAWRQEDNNGGDACLASEETEAEVLQESTADRPVNAPGPEQDSDSASSEGKTAPKSQHASSMSFARTVSHEVSFGDDDEGDWDLSRRDTDSFKFMPPSDRTNSFPVVPPISKSEGQDQPLPSNQAMDVLEEVEKDVFEETYLASPELPKNPATFPDTHIVPRRRHASSKSIGGNIQDPEAQASDARYEEGMPLIPRSENEDQTQEDANETPKALQNSFDDDNEAGDNFFDQVQDSQEFDGDDDLPNQPLQRKSTMQVLDSMGPEPNSRQSTLEETLEEKEDKAEAPEQPYGLGLTSATDSSEGPSTEHNDSAPVGEDLAVKWQEAFAGDDDDGDFLLEDTNDAEPEGKEVDPAAFFGSDDEGFLDDVDEPTATTEPTFAQGPGTSLYVPQNAVPQSSYVPSAITPAPATPGHAYTPGVSNNALNALPQYGSVPQPTNIQNRPQSFAEKSKGGYASPYDLPTDLVTTIVKPRKRASLQQLSPIPPVGAGPPPIRSASMHSPNSASSPLSPPMANQSLQTPPTLQQKASAPALRSKGSFFEELPMTAKPRTSSRTSHRAPSPAQPPPFTNPPPTTAMVPPPPPPSGSAPPTQPSSIEQPPGIASLVAPERTSPYAPMQSQQNHVSVPSSNAPRYSPAPPPGIGNHMAPPAGAPLSRYSPAPTATKPHVQYGAVGASSIPSPMLPHQPRTSSPLTHFETNQDGERLERRASSSFGFAANRLASLPPTREVDEEEEEEEEEKEQVSQETSTHAPPPAESRYSPAPPQAAARQTPPPSSYHRQSTLSPQKRSTSNYAPQPLQAPAASQPGFEPPPRAQTQSPSAVYGKTLTKSPESSRRPSSAHSPASAMLTRGPQSTYAPATRPRGPSLNMNMVPPTDGREQDPLQRWKGVPIITWGVGGTLVTSFPNSAPRYGMNQSAPSIIRTPGEVKVRNIKDIEPLQERLAKFPGPLKGKSKKKEAIAWLTAGIETLEKDLPDLSFHAQLSLEVKRSIERLLLWKILRIFVENDGTLEGNPAVEKAVRDVLSPGTMTPTADYDAMFPGSSVVGTEMSMASMQADSANFSAMEQIRHCLLRGDREKAVWACADQRLWGHAMLISHTVLPELYKQVAQEFVRKEVNFPGRNNESLAAFYKVLSGNYEDCVDELVPVHARAGLQLMSTGSTTGPTKATLDGLDKWKETLCLILSNRSSNDTKGLNSLGGLLASYGRAEAAHICFLFGRNASIFGGLDDANSNFVLLGSDHRQQSEQFAKETEALQLSEVYEYGLSLAGGLAAAAGSPHLAAYKLQHAMTLAEYGYRDKALQYCDAIATAMTAQTKRSPYHNHVLEAALEDFMTRLKQAPKEETNSWISKPSMNKVSDSMWNRFNKFVAGDEADANNSPGGGEGDIGPFGRIAGTPNISRSPSMSNFETYGAGSPYTHGAGVQPVNAAPSRYAPMTPSSNAGPNLYEPPSSQYAPAPRSSNEYTPNPYEPVYPGSSEPQFSQSNYAPAAKPASEAGYQPGVGAVAEPSLAPAATITPAPYGGYQPSLAAQDDATNSASQGYQPPTYGYEPPQMTPGAENGENSEPLAQDQAGGYEPPSFQPYGYEPPSYEPDPEPSTEDDSAPKPKKKSFMDDDDGDIQAMNAAEKTKAEKDRENEDMFRKAAEEDAKRAAQQPAKKGWGFSGWFGGAKKADPSTPESSPGKPIRAKLGESSSFVYDPELKRWINKKPGAENVEVKKATPPPPRAPRSVTGTPPPAASTPPPLISSNSAPPPLMPPRAISRSATPELSHAASQESLGVSAPMMRSVSNTSAAGPPSGPPSRPATSMSNASSIDDLLNAAPRRPGAKKSRKSGRYVDVMAK